MEPQQGEIDVRAHNRAAWNRQVEMGNVWTVPVTPEQTAAARHGEWAIYLTPTKPVPRDWFPPLAGAEVLCLASGGGQQGPILAAAGAHITVFDNSPRQLAQDRMVAERDGIEIATIEGDMRNLSVLADERFDLIFHPVSNNFVPAVRPVWREAHRVLRPGGALLAGFGNPVVYLFDWPAWEEKRSLVVTHPLPYSDLERLTPEEKARYHEQGDPFEFSHTLEEQIGGQLDVGFLLAGFYEDYTQNDDDILAGYMPTFIATRAIKP
ncbi:MAG: class I SAM-dependent methyltransferase [Anaerolineae bacterium]|nr:class I SAM-dependent methyltransferase [Anaerolineae bacterium]